MHPIKSIGQYLWAGSICLWIGFLWGQDNPLQVSELQPIPHPILDKADPGVQSHLQEEKLRFDEATHPDRSPGRAHFAQAYSRLARVYHAYQFSDAALACYLNLNHVQPDVYPCLYAIGKIYHSQGRFSLALDYLLRAREIANGLNDTPASVKLAMNCLIGDACLKENRLSEAYKAFETAKTLNPESAFAWHGIGLIHSINGHSNEAISALEQALKLQPQATVGRVLLVREYRKAGRIEKAMDAQQGLKNNRTTPFTFYDPILSQDVMPLNRSAESAHRSALRAMEQGNLELAVELFNTALNLNPALTLAKANLAGILLKLNQTEKAESWAREIISEQPDNGSFYTLLGVTLLKQAAFKEAYTIFERAHDLEPTNAKPVYWIGASLSWQRRHDEALALFQKACDLDPGDPQAHIAKAVMLSALERHDEAVQLLTRCYELFPHSISVKLHLAQGLSAFRTSQIESSTKALELALPIFEQLKSVPAAVAVAMAYAANKDFAKAIEVQQWAIEQAAQQGYAFDLPWLKRTMQQFQNESICQEPWNRDAGFPALEGMPSLGSQTKLEGR